MMIVESCALYYEEYGSQIHLVVALHCIAQGLRRSEGAGGHAVGSRTGEKRGGRRSY